MKTKYYKIYGSVKYLFDGNNTLYIKVTKETKDFIEGFKIWNWRGNYFGKEEPQIYGEKITINKSSLTAFQEVKMEKMREKKHE